MPFVRPDSNSDDRADYGVDAKRCLKSVVQHLTRRLQNRNSLLSLNLWIVLEKIGKRRF